MELLEEITTVQVASIVLDMFAFSLLSNYIVLH